LSVGCSSSQGGGLLRAEGLSEERKEKAMKNKYDPDQEQRVRRAMHLIEEANVYLESVGEESANVSRVRRVLSRHVDDEDFEAGMYELNYR